MPRDQALLVRLIELRGCEGGNFFPPPAVQTCSMRSVVRGLVALLCLAGAVAAEDVPLSDAQERLARFRTLGASGERDPEENPLCFFLSV